MADKGKRNLTIAAKELIDSKMGDKSKRDIERIRKLRDEVGALILKRDAARECAMCLTEEKSIMFLPCAHQLLCIKCSVVDEQKGTNECPACRTRILKRIALPFLPPRKE